MIALLLACAATQELDLGASTVTITPNGTAALTVDGEQLWSMPTVEHFEVRSFDETVDANLGIWDFERTGQTRHLLTRVDRIDVDGSTATVALASVDDQVTGVLTIESTPSATHFTLSVDAAADSLAVPAHCDPEGSFHGFGEQYNATEQRGEAFTLLVSEQGIGRDGEPRSLFGDLHTSYFPMPWYLDARGFGVLFHTDRRVEVDVCATDPTVAWIEVVGQDEIRWTVFHGPDPLDVIEQLGDEIGRPTAPPEWALGTWLCMQGGIDRVREQVALAEAAGIPATVLWVQDWTGRRQNPGGGYGVQYRWVPDETELYPDIADFFQELHDGGYRVVGYVNPFVDAGLDDHWPELEAGGMLPLDPETGEVYRFIGPRGSMTTADLSNPDTQAYIKEHLTAAVRDVGLDGWMADFAEWLPLDADIHTGDAAAFHNRYPEAWQRLTREVMEQERPDGDWLMFARSGWTGVHGVAQVHWVGDQEADWSDTDGLPTVVPAMLNLGLSGQPFVTHDIAGFSGGPSDKELYLRWTELGAFTPFMRTHDGNERDENHRWDTDAETTAHFVRMARIHDALGPELAALMDTAEATGAPIVRHLMLEFPDDLETWGLSDQYLLGPDLLVAPVVHPGVSERDVYLPQGSWFSVWDGSEHVGPGWIVAPAPIGEPPVFARGADRTDLRAIE